MSMRKKYSGSVVRANPVVPTEDSASGIWTLDQQNQNQKRGTWPFVGDPNFKDTVLLLHGDTSQTPSSEDLSGSNHETTIAADARAINWSAFNLPEGYWSVFIDGTDDILSVPNSSNHEFGTGQFTVELWVYMLDKSASSGQGFLGNYGDGSNGWAVQLYGNNLEFAVKNGQIAQYDWSSRENNRWYHLAFARDGSNNMRAFIDGTQVVTGVKTDNITIGSNALQIGNMGPDIARRFKGGYISNVRIVKGTALYTSTFTKSTAPLTTASQGATASGVELLMCQSNSFVDNSSNAFTVTLTSTPKVETFSPFSYTPTAVENNYGSYYFDGAADGITTLTSSDFAFGTGDFTFECFAYPTTDTSSGTKVLLDLRNANNGDTDHMSAIVWTGSNMDCYSGSSFSSGTDLSFPRNAWTHLCVQRISNVLYFSTNGKVSSTAPAFTRNLTANGKATIGGNVDLSSSMYTGYMMDLRITKGRGVYGTSDFTPRKKPIELTLTEGENSVYFDGTGDYLSIASNADFTFGTGDFTIEMWVYAVKTTEQALYDGRSANGAYPYILIQNTSNKFIYYVSTGVQITANDTVPLNQWVHLAIARSGTTTKMFVNGTAQTETFSDSTNYLEADVVIGQNQPAGGENFEGYISNLRVVKGTALYTTNFTVSTAPSPATTGVLLACASRYIEDRSPANNDITAYGNSVVSGFNPFNDGYWSNYFDGTGDYLQLTSTDFTDFDFGTGPFLIEFWIYYTTLGAAIIGQTGWGNTVQIRSNVFEFYQAASSGNSGTYWITGTTTVTTYKWHHLAIQRDGSGNLDLWVNGSRDTTNTAYASTEMKFHSAKGDITLQNWNGNVSAGVNYISNLRIKNSAVYTSGATITVPTAPFTSDANTKLLMCQSNRFIDNSSSSHSITVNGDTAIKEFIPFELPSRQTKLLALHNNQDINNDSFQDSSLLKNFITRTGNVAQGTFSPFSAEDGYWSSYHISNSGYYFPHSSDYNLGSGEFTVEFWMNTNIITGTQYVCGQVGSGGAGSDTAIQIYISGSSGQIVLYLNAGVQLTSPTSSISANTWHFVSCVRQSNTLRMYIDGVQVISGAFSATVLDSAGGFGIGQTGEYVGDGFRGYISNLRFVVGSCLRDDGTTFSVPTTPLTSTGAETKILTAQSNYFKDNSPTGRTATLSNTPKIYPYAPFAPRRSYSKEEVGGSAYFDGTGDYLTVENDVIDVGTNLFTVEIWVYLKDSSSFCPLWGISNGSGSALKINLHDSGNGSLTIENTGGGGNFSTDTGVRSIMNNAWTHIVFVREGTGTNQSYIYVNGVVRGTGTVSANLTGWTGGFRFARNPEDYSSAMAGYISNARIIKNRALYTSSFTVPTSPLTAVTNTSLLLNFTDGAVINNTGKNNLETVGNAKVSPYIKKFGNGSMYFDGSSGDHLKDYTSNPLYNFGTGNFTIEFFVYATDSGANRMIVASNANFPYVNLMTANSIQLVVYNGTSGTGHTFSLGSDIQNAWHHIAVVRQNSTTAECFLNGVSKGTVTLTASHTVDFQAAGLLIGEWGNAQWDFQGYLDEVRLTRAARYTSNFTAPIRAFKNR